MNSNCTDSNSTCMQGRGFSMGRAKGDAVITSRMAPTKKKSQLHCVNHWIAVDSRFLSYD